ncbi:hypothetical protein FS749_006232 [Ceratobasidium sp. UAMH 11750]|nr:hypothetical protein FS749_006232 [Ceratobasidium sp. UAMH 11750]
MELHRFVKARYYVYMVKRIRFPFNIEVQGSADVQRAELHAHQLATDNRVKQIQDSLASVKEATEQFSKTLVDTWKPNESQKKIVRDLCWNYLTYDLDSYLQLHTEVQAVIEKDPTITLNLPDYKKNVALTEGVNSHIRSEANNIKSRFKKKMDGAVASRQPLEDLTRSILKAHRTNFTSSSTIDNTHKAVLANYNTLQRDVALRLQKQPIAESDADTSSQAQSEGGKGRTLRADSGYWKTLDDETGKRLETLGKDRANDKWAEWRRDIIMRDENRYGIRGISTNALRDATMTDASGGYLRNAAPDS